MMPQLICTIAVILVVALHTHLTLTALTACGTECKECGIWSETITMPWMLIVDDGVKFHYTTLIGPKVAIGNSQGLEHSTAEKLKAYAGLTNVLEITDKTKHLVVEKIVAKRSAEAAAEYNVLVLLILKTAANSGHEATVRPLCLSHTDLQIAPHPVAKLENKRDIHRQKEVFKALPFVTYSKPTEYKVISMIMKTSYQLVKGAAVIYRDGKHDVYSLAGVQNEDDYSHEMTKQPQVPFLNADSEEVRQWIVEKSNNNIICQRPIPPEKNESDVDDNEPKPAEKGKNHGD